MMSENTKMRFDKEVAIPAVHFVVEIRPMQDNERMFTKNVVSAKNNSPATGKAHKSLSSVVLPHRERVSSIDSLRIEYLPEKQFPLSNGLRLCSKGLVSHTRPQRLLNTCRECFALRPLGQRFHSVRVKMPQIFEQPRDLLRCLVKQSLWSRIVFRM